MAVKAKTKDCVMSAHTQSLEKWGALSQNVKFHTVQLAKLLLGCIPDRTFKQTCEVAHKRKHERELILHQRIKAEKQLEI